MELISKNIHWYCGNEDIDLSYEDVMVFIVTNIIRHRGKQLERKVINFGHF